MTTLEDLKIKISVDTSDLSDSLLNLNEQAQKFIGGTRKALQNDSNENKPVTPFDEILNLGKDDILSEVVQKKVFSGKGSLSEIDKQVLQSIDGLKNILEANQRALPPVNVARGVVSVSENPLSAIDAGSSARIDNAQHDKHFGFGTFTYNSGSITSLNFSTKYFVYTDDPNLEGGAVTYFATTTKTEVTDSNSRIYIGEVTTPADGGSSSSGAGGGGLLGDVLV